MKIRTIEIENFGQFHTFRLEAPADGIWRIEGANEFGKTTLLEFIRRIFWGFPDRRSNLNPYPAANGDGPYGGRLELELTSGERVTAERIGLGKNGVFRFVRADGTQGTEAEWQKLLGISENFYRNVYAFTIDELGELKSLDQEEIRNRLYGAGIAFGNVSLSALGAVFDKRAAALCLLQGRKNRIAELCAELRQLDDAAATALEALPLYEAAQQRESDARTEAAQLRAERVRVENALREMERVLKGAPLRQRLTATEAELTILPTPPADLPADPAAEFARLRTLRDRSVEEMQQTAERLTALEEKLRETPPPEIDPALEEHVAALERELPEFRRNTTEIIRLRELLSLTQRTRQEIAGELSDVTGELPRIPEPTREHADRLRSFVRRRERLEFGREQNPPHDRRVWKRWNLCVLLLAVCVAATLPFLPQFGWWIGGIAAAVALVWSIPRRERHDPLAEEFGQFQLEWDAFRARFFLSEHCTPAMAENIFARLSEWRRLETETTACQQRLEAAQEAVAAFKTRCAALPGATEMEPEPLLAALRIQLMQAGEIVEKRAFLNTRLQDSRQEEAERLARRNDAESALRTFLRQCGLDDERGMEGFLENLRKRRHLEQQRDETRAALTAIFGKIIPPPPDCDPHRETERLSEELVSISNRLAELERSIGAAAAECERLRRESDPATAANRAESCRGELRHAVREFLMWREARNLLDRAIARYERERQPEVIRRAAELFSGFTANRYTHLHKSLTTGELLVSDTATRQKKTPSMLSRGTLEELMLAMRLALIECNEENNEPLPVVLDDITVNFDSTRRAAVLETLERFAVNRQVILFTAG